MTICGARYIIEPWPPYRRVACKKSKGHDGDHEALVPGRSWFRTYRWPNREAT